MRLTRTLGIGLLTATFLTTLCACGKSATTPNQITSNPTASVSIAASTADSEHTATLYLMTASGEQGQYKLDYSGDLKADQLLQGLTDLTGYHFDAAKTELSDQKLIVYWADTATFEPDTGTTAEPNRDLDLTFSDFDSELQFMLDTAYTTLTKNLNVTEVYFVTAAGNSLDFTTQAKWKLPADQAYNGVFNSYYLTKNATSDGSGSGSASTLTDDSTTGTKSNQNYIFLDRRTNPSDSGDNLSPDDAAKAVYESVVANYQGNVDSNSDWYIALDEMKEIKGSEGYSFSVGQGSSENFTPYFYAVVTYNRNIYLLKDGASDYTFYGKVPNS